LGVSGQLEAALLPGNPLLVFIGWENGLNQKPVWTIWGKRKAFPLVSKNCAGANLVQNNLNTEKEKNIVNKNENNCVATT
jgi:hypothetical protein